MVNVSTNKEHVFPDDFVEVTLTDPSNFLKIKETLTRIGVASKDQTKLFQSCHILHKKSKYYIVHFKELFMLDGKNATFNETDLARRNTICRLLEEWDLLSVVNSEQIAHPTLLMSKLKIVRHNEKDQWELIEKYNLGGKKLLGFSDEKRYNETL